MPIDYGAIRDRGRAAEQSWASALKNNPLLDANGMSQIVQKNTATPSNGNPGVFNERGWQNDVTTALLSTVGNPSGRMLQWIAGMVPNMRNMQKVSALAGTGGGMPGQTGAPSLEPTDFVDYLSRAIGNSTSGLPAGDSTRGVFNQAISNLQRDPNGSAFARSMSSGEMDDLLTWAMGQATPYMYSRMAPGMNTALAAAHLTSPTYDGGLAGWLQAYQDQFKPAGYGF
jgi:hypothetical protein